MSFEFSKDEIIKGKYCFEGDKVEEYNKEIEKIKHKNDYFYHLEVLPQPFFGNIDNPKILFLALNPSYDDISGYKDSDDITKLKENCENIGIALKEYIENLDKVDFLEKIENDNKFYVNSTKSWWQGKVYGDLEKIRKVDKNEIGYINLSPYHSRKYYDNKINKLEYHNTLMKKLELLQKSSRLELVVVIWGKTIWDNFIKKEYLKYDNLDSFFKDKIVITLNKSDKKGFKYNLKINKISEIVTSEDGYKDRYCDNELEKLCEIFKK